MFNIREKKKSDNKHLNDFQFSFEFTRDKVVDNVFLAIDKDDTIIGGILISDTRFFYEGKPYLYIECLETKSGYRKSGIGSALIDVAINIAIKNNCQGISLRSLPLSIEFYKHRGFVQISRNLTCIKKIK